MAAGKKGPISSTEDCPRPANIVMTATLGLENDSDEGFDHIYFFNNPQIHETVM